MLEFKDKYKRNVNVGDIIVHAKSAAGAAYIQAARVTELKIPKSGGSCYLIVEFEGDPQIRRNKVFSSRNVIKLDVAGLRL